MEDNQLPKLVFIREKSENKVSHNWAMGIKSLLEKSGFAYMWDLGIVMYEGAFLRQMRQRLRDMYIQNWAEKCDGSGKFVTCRSYKIDFGQEKYLGSINIR